MWLPRMQRKVGLANVIRTSSDSDESGTRSMTIENIETQMALEGVMSSEAKKREVC